MDNISGGTFARDLAMQGVRGDRAETVHSAAGAYVAVQRLCAAFHLETLRTFCGTSLLMTVGIMFVAVLRA